MMHFIFTSSLTRLLQACFILLWSSVIVYKKKWKKKNEKKKKKNGEKLSYLAFDFSKGFAAWLIYQWGFQRPDNFHTEFRCWDSHPFIMYMSCYMRKVPSDMYPAKTPISPHICIVHMKELCILGYCKMLPMKILISLMNTQADLNLRLAHVGRYIAAHSISVFKGNCLTSNCVTFFI